ncbi:hypothetical protein ACIGO6_00715 [Streptomyces sp. NPDC053750]|uniref:hypothetical protein n=1 Tax=Streptomyces sp. NPDC053750 TaxID=3365714 RepID=UPI0037D6484C
MGAAPCPWGPAPPHDGRALELGTPGETRERLNALVLAGRKTATTGLLAEYVEENGVQ